MPPSSWQVCRLGTHAISNICQRPGSAKKEKKDPQFAATLANVILQLAKNLRVDSSGLEPAVYTAVRFPGCLCSMSDAHHLIHR